MLEEVVEHARQQTGVPGIAAALVEGGDVVWGGGFGSSRSDPDRAIQPDTIFAVASLSKPPFAHAVLRLCERGRLDLDAPLSEQSGITARHVLSHTSGLGNWEKPAADRAGFEPGTSWHYSGEGYAYLQAVVEQRVGSSLEQLAAAEVFRPLEMASTSYLWPDPAVSETYARVDAELSAAFSLHTTAPDYARFVADTMTSEIGQAMLEPQVAVDEVLAWGLGWGLAGEVFWHWGDGRDAESVVVASRQDARGIVCLTNGAGGLEACFEIVGRVLGERAAFPIRAVLERGW